MCVYPEPACCPKPIKESKMSHSVALDDTMNTPCSLFWINDWKKQVFNKPKTNMRKWFIFADSSLWINNINCKRKSRRTARVRLKSGGSGCGHFVSAWLRLTLESTKLAEAKKLAVLTKKQMRTFAVLYAWVWLWDHLRLVDTLVQVWPLTHQPARIPYWTFATS